MVKSQLPVFTRDRRTGSMKELTPGETVPYPLLRDPAAARHFRVLVADSHEVELRFTIQQLGEAWPFARDLVAECATDGVETLQKLRRRAYAFVVLDWNLPHVDGTAVLQAIRAEGLRVPVVVVAAQQRTAIATDLESLAAAFVNKKQLNPTRLVNAMAAAILLQQRVFGLASTEPIHTPTRLPAQAAEGRFVGRSLPLYVCPAALGELPSPNRTVRVTPNGDKTVSPRIPRAARKQNIVTEMKPSLAGVCG